MAHYYFNTVDGGRSPDPEGVELPDLATARLEAVKLPARLPPTSPMC